MKEIKSSFKHNPFEPLKDLLKNRAVPFPDAPAGGSAIREEPPEKDEQFFLEAMKDVTPLAPGNRAAKGAETRHPETRGNSEEGNALLALRDLVANGKGFAVADTPEYVEGTGYEGNIAFAGRLHRGDFSIQAYIDLHGLNVEEAREALELFLDETVACGRRAVSIIHGRGLSSPAEPVLKNKVIEWLTSGRWRKWVIAYASARACDGGAGATYVLLRRRPYSRRHGKSPSKRTAPGSGRS